MTQNTTDISQQLLRYLREIKTNAKLGVINVVSKLIVAQVENVSKEVKKELNSYEVKFELYKKVLWKTLFYILQEKNTYSRKLINNIYDSQGADEFIKAIKVEMVANPYFCLDFIEGAFMVLRDLLPESQTPTRFVPTLNTQTKQMSLEEKRAMAAKLLNLLESDPEPNDKIPVDILPDQINIAENRSEIDQGVLESILNSSQNSPRYLEISISLSNLAGLITGNLDPNDLVPDFVPVSDKTETMLLVDVLISETNKIRHMLPGQTVGLKKF